MGIEIRPLEAEDEPAWRRLWTGYLEFYGTSVTPEVYAETFRRILSPEVPEMGAFLAFADGPVGLTHYLFHRHFWKLEGICYLQDLYVDPKARVRGAGRALIEAVYAEADRRGCPSVYWTTQEFNMPARHLYEHVGRLTPFIKYQR